MKPPLMGKGAVTDTRSVEVIDRWKVAGPGSLRLKRFAMDAGKLSSLEFVKAVVWLLGSGELDGDEEAEFFIQLGIGISQNPLQWKLEALDANGNRKLAERICRELGSHAGKMTSTQALEVARLLSAKSGNAPLSATATFLIHASKGDPAEAAAVAKEISAGRIAPGAVNPLTSVIVNWAAKDQDSAVSWIQSNLAGEELGSAAKAVVSRWLRLDSLSASNQIRELPQGSFKDWAALQIAVFCKQKNDVEAAEAWVQSIQDNGIRTRANVMIR